MDVLLHPSELWAIVSYKLFNGDRGLDKSVSNRQDEKDIHSTDSRTQCYHFLNTTSRSFAAVVQALDMELRDVDDMTIPTEEKVPLLKTFHLKLYEKGWQFHGNHEKEKDRILLQHFNVVIEEFARLKPVYQHVLEDICQQMGDGMAEFSEHQKIGSKQDWDLYCHYVAGLVGIGLCRLFASSGLEDQSIAQVEPLANHMGLFLQKVNIIRDFLEDLTDGRTFWPEEVWSKYVPSLEALKLPNNRDKALDCMNELICDALRLIPDCLQFMSMLKDESVFRFCAIPQVMAIATLALCFDNPRVFKENVKIRKGLALQLIMHASDMASVVRIFVRFCRDIAQRIDPARVHAVELSCVLARVDAWCHHASENTVYSMLNSGH